MTAFSPEYINRVRGGFQGDSVEKVLRLQELLKDFLGHPFIKGRVVLKGGTAINQFYFKLPRISVDIDLDYIGSACNSGDTILNYAVKSVTVLINSIQS